METKVLEIENIKEENRELKKQIAMLKDGFGYQKDMADVYAKVLREIYDWIEELQDEDIIQDDLKKIKNLIPETALRRGK